MRFLVILWPMDERVTRPELSSSDEATEWLEEESESVDPEVDEKLNELEPEKWMDELLELESESERVESTEMSESSLL